MVQKIRCFLKLHTWSKRYVGISGAECIHCGPIQYKKSREKQ